MHPVIAWHLAEQHRTDLLEEAARFRSRGVQRRRRAAAPDASTPRGGISPSAVLRGE